VKELDAFPKVPESYVESTASGGTGTDTLVAANTAAMSHSHKSHSETLSSVSDSFHPHGCPCLPGILCVQKHMDEVRV